MLVCVGWKSWSIRDENVHHPNICKRKLICILQVTTHTHTHPFNSHFPGLPRWAGTRKVKPIWILLKQGTMSSSGISWAICKSAPRSRQITMPTPHHSVFFRPDALPAAQPTASKHWRHMTLTQLSTVSSLHVYTFSTVTSTHTLQLSPQTDSRPLQYKPPLTWTFGGSCATLTARPNDPWNEELFRTTKDPGGLSFSSWIAAQSHRQQFNKSQHQAATELMSTIDNITSAQRRPIHNPLTSLYPGRPEWPGSPPLWLSYNIFN